MLMTKWRCLLVCVLMLSGTVSSVLFAEETIDFGRQVRPILSDHCFRCHGPDAHERQAGLRLDVKEGIFGKGESGLAIITPGKADTSELIRRINCTEADEQMPPAGSTKELSAREKEILANWIDQGASWSLHWSFESAKKPSVPAVSQKTWVRNDVDAFVLSKLEKLRIAPAPEADRRTLIRRLSLDLTGLPSTPAEVEDFVRDARPNAYEILVDRLLASPHFGERLALDWLDASRFADTHGFHIDSGRDMTAWRDWVIASFNQNKPFDEFVLEQLAGDLLPNPTVEQRIATGFNRNHMINFEGGAIPEEYHHAYIVDRVNTTATVFLGLTIACAQCHDHKYDPISQKEYYQLYAFFHNVPENGLDGSKGNAAPMLPIPTREQIEREKLLAREEAKINEREKALLASLEKEQLAWEESQKQSKRVAWLDLKPTKVQAESKAIITVGADNIIAVTGENPDAERYTISLPLSSKPIGFVKLEIFPDDSLVEKGPGRSVNGNFVLTNVQANYLDAQKPNSPMLIKIHRNRADFSQDNFEIGKAFDSDPATGWAIFPEVGKPHSAIFELERPISAAEGELRITLDFRSQFASHQFARFRIRVSDDAEALDLSGPPSAVQAILKLPREKRTPAQLEAVAKYFRANHAPSLLAIKKEREAIANQRADLQKRIPTTMVMQEMPAPRETHVMIRGAYDKRGEKVSAGVPSSLPPLPSGAPANRLGLARWLIDPKHPLTSRVIANRYWQMFFATGLVKTAEDFGSQGELPSNPELLDWLSVAFIDGTKDSGGHGWDVKHLVRTLVTSASYRQSSIMSRESIARDPENRLVSRGSRYRLPAEFIRDLALCTSGLLSNEIGGASVSPYQPEGLWEELTSRLDNKNWTAQSYSQSKGKDLYKRTMYTFWKRTAPPPSLLTFDAPDRETCTVRRARTNTPLQSLVLLNDPTYVEASRHLAGRVLREADKDFASRADHLYMLVLGRHPSPKEVDVLTKLADAQHSRFARERSAADQLLRVGESTNDPGTNATDLATWTVLSSVVLNLDEAVTRG